MFYNSSQCNGCFALLQSLTTSRMACVCSSCPPSSTTPVIGDSLPSILEWCAGLQPCQLQTLVGKSTTKLPNHEGMVSVCIFFCDLYNTRSIIQYCSMLSIKIGGILRGTQNFKKKFIKLFYIIDVELLIPFPNLSPRDCKSRGLFFVKK